MKQQIFIFIAIVGLVACSKETVVLQNEGVSTTKVSNKEEVANKHYVESSKKEDNKYRMTRETDPVLKLFSLHSELNRETMGKDWQTVHQIAQNGLTPVLGQKDYLFDIQAVSYRVLDHKLLLEKEGSPELQEAILFYLNTLMEVKAVDLKVLSAALTRVGNSLEPATFSAYRTYILARAEADLLEYEPLLAAQQEKLKHSEDANFHIRRHIASYQAIVEDANAALQAFEKM